MKYISIQVLSLAFVKIEKCVKIRSFIVRAPEVREWKLCYRFVVETVDIPSTKFGFDWISPTVPLFKCQLLCPEYLSTAGRYRSRSWYCTKTEPSFEGLFSFLSKSVGYWLLWELSRNGISYFPDTYSRCIVTRDNWINKTWRAYMSRALTSFGKCITFLRRFRLTSVYQIDGRAGRPLRGWHNVSRVNFHCVVEHAFCAFRTVCINNVNWIFRLEHTVFVTISFLNFSKHLIRKMFIEKC